MSFTSRSILPLVFIVFTFLVFSKINLSSFKKLTFRFRFSIIFLSILFASLCCYLFIATDFLSVLSLYFNERLITILQLDDSGIQGSINDNVRLTNLPLNLESFFGLGNYRFSSNLSGGDSFYTRWIFGVGYFVLIPLEILKIVLLSHIFQTYISILFYVISIYLEPVISY